MDDETQLRATIQDHAAYLLGSHDFQHDIDMLAGSETVGTLLETVMLATNMRFAAVARVTADRWVACRTVDEVNFGLSAGDEIGIDQTFCQSVHETSEKVLFNNVATDDVYRNHPIAAQFGIGGAVGQDQGEVTRQQDDGGNLDRQPQMRHRQPVRWARRQVDQQSGGHPDQQQHQQAVARPVLW